MASLELSNHRNEHPTRREVLQGALCLGVAAGLSGCRVPGARRAIQGSIVGAHDVRGHRVRADWPNAPVLSREELEVLIVGGGVSGLAAGWRLQGAGLQDFQILELEDSLGGTAQSGASEISQYPWGAHYLPVPRADQHLVVRLLREMGLVTGVDGLGRILTPEEARVRAPQERLFHRGLWTEGLYLRDGASASDLGQLERFEFTVRCMASVAGVDGRRSFTLPIADCSRDPAVRGLDRLSMRQWLDMHGFDSPRLRWYVEYACRDDFGATLEHTSAWAGLHYYCSRLDAEGEPAEFLTWPEGNSALAQALARGFENRVRTGMVVLSIEGDGDSARVVAMDERAGGLREVRARRVICAIPRYVASRIVRGADPRPAAAFRYSPWCVANITLRGQPRETGFPLCWDNVLFESSSLGYVVSTHQLDRLEGGSVWTWYRPHAEEDPAVARAALLARPWEAHRDEVLRDLGRAHPGFADEVDRIDVWRWGHGMVRPEPGFLFGRARQLAARPYKNIHFASADLSGIPIFEEAQWQGARAAEEVLAARGQTFTSWL
ncbi:MAG: FAD-dependent oxidoreductase [Planctomycetes bacterium]|nr:FAD-dependent oxidoreductase [Planctomycetota bacterium]